MSEAVVQRLLRLLIIEDSEDDALLAVRELRHGGYEVIFERVETAAAMQAALARAAWDVVIADYSLPHFSGLAALTLLKGSGLDLPFLIVSGAIGEDVAVESMRHGAHDYVMKGRLARLAPAVERELREAEVRRERRRAEEDLRKAHEELEQRVEDRTRALALANEELRREIAERKELERQRDELLKSERAARGEAERASHLKDEFVATLSHELRNPLNAILGWAQFLRRPRRSQADISEAIEIIESSGRALADLVSDLLDMSRIISGKLRLDVRGVELQSVVASAVEAAKPAASAKNIRLETVLDPAVGTVRGDPNRLRQIVWNLLSNAVKFTNDGGRVEITVQPVNGCAEISVSDTGQGIEPEFLPHIFERYRQEDASAARVHGGLGLGLSIVRHLAELHGGSVRATSPGRGQGATFTFTLPLPAAPESGRPGRDRRTHSPSAAALGHEEITLRGLKVLVVEDEPDALELLKRVLEERQAQVFSASSAAAGMELLQRARPDVIVSDIGLPQEDGYQFMRHVRMLGPECGGATPALALTAFAGTADRQRAILSGFQAHIAKPIEVPLLLITIASLVGRVMYGPSEAVAGE